MNVVYSVACPSGPLPRVPWLLAPCPLPPPHVTRTTAHLPPTQPPNHPTALHSSVIIVASCYSFSLLFSLRAFCSRFFLCVGVCFYLSMYLCVTRIRKKHHAPSHHPLHRRTTTRAVATGASGPVRTSSLSTSHIPRTPPTSVARCLGVFQFDMLDRFSLISSAGQRCQHRQSAAVVIVSLRCACRRQFIAFLL